MPPAEPDKKTRRNLLFGTGFRSAVTSAAITLGIGGGVIAPREDSDQAQKAPEQAPEKTTDNFLKSLLEHYSHIAFGDTDHTAEEINLFIAAHMKTLQEAGVDAIFLEVDQEHQADIDKYLSKPFSHQYIATHDFINKLAKEYGIKVFLMDVPVVSDAAKRGEELYLEYVRLTKEDGPDAETTLEAEEKLSESEDYEAFLEERRKANQAWVNCIKETVEKNTFDKIVSVGGTYHYNNPAVKGDPASSMQDDFDELSDYGMEDRCVRVDIRTSKNISRFKITHPSAGRGVADHIIDVPTIDDEIKRKLTFDIFNALDKSGRWETLNTQPPEIRNFLNMHADNYMTMCLAGDVEHAHLYRHLSPTHVDILKAEGLFEEAATLTSERAYYLSNTLNEFSVAMEICAEENERIPNTEEIRRLLEDAKRSYLEKHFAEALEYTKKALERCPDSPNASLKIAITFAQASVRNAYDASRGESLKRQGRHMAVRIIEHFNACMPSPVMLMGFPGALSAAQQKIKDEDHKRAEIFYNALNALYDDDPRKAKTLIEQLEAQDVLLVKLLKHAPREGKDLSQYELGFFGDATFLQEKLKECMDELDRYILKKDEEQGKGRGR